MVELLTPVVKRSSSNGQLVHAHGLVADGLARVERHLRAFPDIKPDGLRLAVDAIVSSGGKRVRPMVALLVAGMFDAQTDERAVAMAGAVEMLHTATLVHDDLIDGSLMRRGAATLNSAWTPAATVLTGDFLFAYAAQLAARANSVRVMSIFADTLSVIVGGELQQSFTDWEQRATRDDYYRRIYAKTASMFVLATTAAGVVGGASEGQVEALRQYGNYLGIAFQIIDDILDFTGDPSKVGKPVGSDLRRGLITLPTLYYVERHGDDPALACALQGECEPEEYDRLIDRIRRSDAVAAAFAEAEEFGSKAQSALLTFDRSDFRDALSAMVEYTVSRKV